MSDKRTKPELQDTEYLHFEYFEPTPSRITHIVVVVSKSSLVRGSRDVLGNIVWHGPWRQYVFNPAPSCLFNKGCMKDIIEVIDKLMEARKDKR